MGEPVKEAFSTCTVLFREKIKPEQQASSTHFMWRLPKLCSLPNDYNLAHKANRQNVLSPIPSVQTGRC